MANLTIRPPLPPRLPIKYHTQNLNNQFRIVPRSSSLNQREMVTWYLTTLAMRQQLITQNHEYREWVITIEDKLKQVHRDEPMTSWGKQNIYRVPHYLKEKDKKSYSPQTVSLGPYHYGKEHLLPMEYHKWRAVNMVMKRNNQNIELYINAMKELEKRARACYEGPISLNRNDFIQMLVLDGCFVIELFRGASKDKGFLELGYDRNDPVFAMRGLMHSIQRDMIMLENQLPLFVLNRLLELQPGTGNQTVAKLAIQFLNPLMPLPTNIFDPITDMDELHCLDVFRRHILRPHKKEGPKRIRKTRAADKRVQRLVHSVTELRKAGVEFRTRYPSQLSDIRFENGCLEMSTLFIHDGTESLFSNLIAFEQCHIDLSNEITSYIIFMENLINSAEDVKYLHSSGIIHHWLGNDSEVADLFNRLSQEVTVDKRDSYLFPLSSNINQFYRREWNFMKATLKHDYFYNPWTYISFSAAVILLLLTLFQSIFSFLSYFYPRS